MRLLYVIDSLAGGGAESSLAEMTPYLVAEGIDLHVLPLKPALDLQDRMEKGGAFVHRPADLSGRPQFARRIREVAKSLRPDLLHTTLFESDVLGRPIAAVERIPSSTSWVNTRPARSPVGWFRSASTQAVDAAEGRRSRQLVADLVDRLSCRTAGRFHAVSEAVASDVGAAMGVDMQKIDVIPRGRDLGRFPYRDESQRRRARGALGLSPRQKVVLAVGRHEPQKALHHVIDSVSQLGNEGLDVVLLIAGRAGRETERLERLASAAKAEVRFLGHRTDVPALMAAADVLAFPSEREGSPGTLIEAMAIGLPIVTTDIDPCVEVLGGRQQDIARLVSSGDTTALTRSIDNALQPSVENAAKVARGRRRFEDHYTMGVIGPRMAEFFRSVIES